MKHDTSGRNLKILDEIGILIDNAEAELDKDPSQPRDFDLYTDAMKTINAQIIQDLNPDPSENFQIKLRHIQHRVTELEQKIKDTQHKLLNQKSKIQHAASITSEYAKMGMKTKNKLYK